MESDNDSNRETGDSLTCNVGAGNVVEVTIAVLSDPHFVVSDGAKTTTSWSHLKINANGDLADSRPEVNPWAGLGALVRDAGLRANALICPGDIATGGDKAALRAGWKHLQALGQDLSATRVLCATGNHDVKSRTSKSEVQDNPVKALKQGYGIFEPLKLLDPPYPSIEIGSTNPRRAKSVRTRYFGDGLVLVEDRQYQVLIVNSCCEHGHDSFEYERGTFPKSSLEALKDLLEECDSQKIGIAITHHPPIPHGQDGEGEHDFIDNGSALLKALEDHGPWIVIHGHKHEARVQFASGGSCAPIVFGAASLGAQLERPSGGFKNQFYLLKLTVGVNGQIRGRFRAWDWFNGRGWSKTEPGDGGIYDGSAFGNRDVMATVSAIADATQGKLPMHWRDVIAVIPEAEFISSSDLNQLKNKLRPHKILLRDQRGPSWMQLEQMR